MDDGRQVKVDLNSFSGKEEMTIDITDLSEVTGSVSNCVFCLKPAILGVHLLSPYKGERVHTECYLKNIK